MLACENEHLYSGKQDAAIVVDSQLLFAEGFRSLLQQRNQYSVVISCSRERDMWSSLKQHPGSHLFLDYHLLGLQVSSVLKIIRSSYPLVTPILMTGTYNLFIPQQVIRLGARALMSKFGGSHELSACLRALEIGRKYIAPDIHKYMQQYENSLHPVRFTQKEIQVLDLIARGYTILQTAERLQVSKHTIVAHRRRMMEKSGVNSAPGLVRFGMDAGLIL